MRLIDGLIPLNFGNPAISNLYNRTTTASVFLCFTYYEHKTNPLKRFGSVAGS